MADMSASQVTVESEETRELKAMDCLATWETKAPRVILLPLLLCCPNCRDLKASKKKCIDLLLCLMMAEKKLVSLYQRRLGVNRNSLL